MSQRANVTIPKSLRHQVDELIESGVVTTLASAVNAGLLMLIHEHKLQRWNDQAFSDYKAGLLEYDSSGVLVSIQFRKDLALLHREVPELHRHIRLIFQKLSKNNHKELRIKETVVKGVYVVDMPIRDKFLKLVIRKQAKQFIACRVGYTTDLL